MVQNVPLPCDSTSRAMIASNSDRGAPARINRKMLSTDSEERRPGTLSVWCEVTLGSSGDCSDVPITFPFSTRPDRERSARAKAIAVVWDVPATVVKSVFAGYRSRMSFNESPGNDRRVSSGPSGALRESGGNRCKRTAEVIGFVGGPPKITKS